METFSALLAICAGNSPVSGEFPHKGQWRRALMFSRICAWINDWVNNGEAGDLRRYRTHYAVSVMSEISEILVAQWTTSEGKLEGPVNIEWFVEVDNIHFRWCDHYNDVIMRTMASQITSLAIVYSTVYTGTDEINFQNSASMAFVRGIHWWPVNSPHKGPVTRKMFPFGDVIMYILRWQRSYVTQRTFFRSPSRFIGRLGRLVILHTGEILSFGVNPDHEVSPALLWLMARLNTTVHAT